MKNILSDPSMIKAFVFDLFGTLVNIESIFKAFPELDIKIDEPMLFTEIWYTKQIQYAWFLNSINSFESFGQLSIRALKFTARLFGVELSDEQISRLAEAKLNLDPFPDSERGLQKLTHAKMATTEIQQDGDLDRTRTRLIVLTNGEYDKSDKLLSNSGLRRYFDDIVSADEVRKYKPSRELYLLASKRLDLEVSQIALVSSHLWDIAGAQAAGMHTCWIDRRGYDKQTDEIDIKPDNVCTSVENIGNDISLGG
jgi:2-haloacid dehalogenase